MKKRGSEKCLLGEGRNWGVDKRALSIVQFLFPKTKGWFCFGLGERWCFCQSSLEDKDWTDVNALLVLMISVRIEPSLLIWPSFKYIMYLVTYPQISLDPSFLNQFGHIFFRSWGARGRETVFRYNKTQIQALHLVTDHLNRN